MLDFLDNSQGVSQSKVSGHMGACGYLIWRNVSQEHRVHVVPRTFEILNGHKMFTASKSNLASA